MLRHGSIEGGQKVLQGTVLFGSLIIIAAATGGLLESPPATEEKEDRSTAESKAARLKLTVLFNNILHIEGLQGGWGFACLVEGLDKTILFDTGGDGSILLANMKKLGVDPATVDVVVLSHFHHDHTGGLARSLERNPMVEVWVPASFPDAFRQEVRAAGAEVRIVSDPGKIIDKAYTTGEMGDRIIEQSLILETSQGLVLLTGCAHPGIVEIVRTAKRQRQSSVELVTGGYHLNNLDSRELIETIGGMEEAGVRRVAPSHCTGEEAINLFRELWGDDFVEGGAGAVIELPL
jgi:7,8-dihydropterin-6-yl-methyl-4-(beta-D-ribofuranosyl)aminobenzene 5'-phosphate synthase